MRRSESIKELSVALRKFQAEVTNPKNTNANPMFKSKYAPLNEVINTVKPILDKHGLSFFQDIGSDENRHETIVITTMLLHDSGEWIESSPLVLPAYQERRDGGKVFNAQGAGSAITYGRRYQLSAILGITSEDDEDGNGVSHPQGDSKPQNKGNNKHQNKTNGNVATPSEATLKAKYQLLKGSLDGYEAYMEKLRNEKQYTDVHIEQILTQAIQDKQKHPVNS